MTSLGFPPDNWTLPLTGWYKLNFDGFVNTFTQSSGIGGIIRDDKGEMVAAFVEGVATTHPLVTEL